MMTRTWAWIAMFAFVAMLAGPAIAQQAPATSAPAAKPAEPAKKEPAKSDAKTMAKPKSAAGTVKSASADSLVLLAGKDKKEMTFALDKDTKVTKGGKAATAADIAADDAATVSYTEHDGKMTAKGVAVKAKSTAAAKPKS
jgi:hypothetical protein